MRLVAVTGEFNTVLYVFNIVGCRSVARFIVFLRKIYLIWHPNITVVVVV